MSYGHIEQSMQMLGDYLGCTISNFSYATSFEPPRYQFIVETEGLSTKSTKSSEIALILNRYLTEVNAEYQFCRQRKLIQEPTVILVPYGTYGLLERIWIEEKGNKIGQYKPPRFTNDKIIKK